MKHSILAAIFGAMMLVGFFLPWIVFRDVGMDLRPTSLLTDNPLVVETRKYWQTYIIPLSSALGGLVFLLGFINRSVPRLLALVTGALPIGATIWGISEVRADLPRSVDMPSLSDMTQAFDFIGYGLWVFVAGSILLTLTALFSR
ncbi:MAG: hypothetical protein P8H53_04795 [Paracoccaceae bacterium]|nr:hypothetical protein [Paracoccaceae bacterium]